MRSLMDRIVREFCSLIKVKVLLSSENEWKRSRKSF
jgi:hypothetical protein